VALALGKTLSEALTWAPINSASVVQEIGAQKGLLTLPQLEQALKDAPIDYGPRTI
jgi:sugar/nucleoside kinase (ribokinase family)